MTSFTSGFHTPGSWQWPEDLHGAAVDSTEEDISKNNSSRATDSPGKEPSRSPGGARHWRPRMCRICLETVLPTFQPVSEYIPGVLQSEPSATYISEGGRLLQPCKCKGSLRYVHEKCLQEWRHSDPRYGRSSYWQCPTCRFQYRLERMRWGRWISSQATQLALTFSIFFLTILILGFVADPIMNAYLGPHDIMMSLQTDSDGDLDWIMPLDESGWLEHFIKGFASLGLLGCLKILIMSSSRIMNFRLGTNTNRAGATGRDRIDAMTWIVIAAGVITFVYTVWKAVRAWCRRVLEKASEHVMDVQGEDDVDDEDISEEAVKEENLNMDI